MASISISSTFSASDTDTDAESTHRQSSPTNSNSNSNSNSNYTPTFLPLAHPPPKSHPLRLTPKLLLQIQRLTPTNRPLPILEIWQPSRFTGRPAPSLPKCRPADMYLTQSEWFAGTGGAGAEGSSAPADEDARAAATVVGVIYQEVKKGTAEVRFPWSGTVWVAGVLPGGGYRLSLQGGEGLLEWKRREVRGKGRGGDSPSVSVNGRGGDDEEDDRGKSGGGDGEVEFALGIVQPKSKTRRREWIASLTKQGFYISKWEEMPLATLQEWMALSTEAKGAEKLQLRDAVYVLIMTLGVWVAAQEKWLD